MCEKCPYWDTVFLFAGYLYFINELVIKENQFSVSTHPNKVIIIANDLVMILVGLITIYSLQTIDTYQTVKSLTSVLFAVKLV